MKFLPKSRSFKNMVKLVELIRARIFAYRRYTFRGALETALILGNCAYKCKLRKLFASEQFY